MGETKMTLKQKTINKIIFTEGGYVNNKDDAGGETNYGITKQTARYHGYRGEMKLLSRKIAFAIYASSFWDAQNLSKVQELSEVIAEEVADTSVNMGTSTAAIFLQRSLNVLNNKERYYRDIAVDGQIGKQSITALRMFLKKRGKEGEEVLFGMLNALQGAKYIFLAEQRRKNETFVFGWFANRVIAPVKEYFAYLNNKKALA